MFYSLRNRLIAIFVVLLVFSFGTASYLLFNQSRSIIRSYIESSALEKMDEYGSFINMAFTQIYDLASLVFNSNAAKTWDNALSDPSLSTGDKMLANLSLSQFLTQAANNYSGVSSVSVYRRDGIRVSDGNEIAEDRSFLDTTWYRNFVSGGARWVSAHIDPIEASRSKPYQVVSLLLPIGTFDPSSSRSVLKINVSSDIYLGPLSRIHLGENGTIFLLDQNGNPLLSQYEYYTHPEAAGKVREIRESDALQGVDTLQNGQGGTDILVYKKLPLNNWLLVGLVPEKDLYGKLINLRVSIIVFSSVLLVLSLLAAAWLSYGISKPLSALASAMRHVQKGDFAGAKRRIPSGRSVRNEVGYVTASFSNMVAQLQQHIQKEFELKLLRQQAEYKMLLMQINPHFLFNTLELLSSLSMQQRTQDSIRVIESLGKMLRFSLKISEDIIPLRDELKYLRDYASILQIRFGEKLAVSIREAGELDKLRIVKFLLQPLVENAVKYSFAKHAEARVTVTAAREGDRVRLTVEDNGPGMPPDLVRQLKEEESASRFEQILGSASRQIGLRNVLARCRLYYGRLFTFEIGSEPGHGTRIELILPLQEGMQSVPSADR
jgi:two-component system sensor histidine kinase YesM